MSKAFMICLLTTTAFLTSCKKQHLGEIRMQDVQNRPPAVSAGPDLNVALQAGSCILKGTAKDPENDPLKYMWRKISGPASYKLETPASPETRLTNFEVGVYAFELAVTDSHNATGRDTVYVHISQQQNTAPTAYAGQNIYVSLPATSAVLKGSMLDKENDVASIQWKKLSGPGSYAITNPGSLETDLTNLEKGEYAFELTLIDAAGLQHTDTVDVYVYDPAQKELIFEGLGWICPMGCTVNMKLPPSLVGTNLQVTLRDRYSSKWLTVKPEKQWTSNEEFVYGTDGTSFWIYTNDADGKVDVRIQYQ